MNLECILILIFINPALQFTPAAASGPTFLQHHFPAPPQEFYVPHIEHMHSRTGRLIFTSHHAGGTPCHVVSLFKWACVHREIATTLRQSGRCRPELNPRPPDHEAHTLTTRLPCSVISRIFRQVTKLLQNLFKWHTGSCAIISICQKPFNLKKSEFEILNQ